MFCGEMEKSLGCVRIRLDYLNQNVVAKSQDLSTTTHKKVSLCQYVVPFQRSPWCEHSTRLGSRRERALKSCFVKEIMFPQRKETFCAIFCPPAIVVFARKC